jgi:hypothetical protein
MKSKTLKRTYRLQSTWTSKHSYLIDKEDGAIPKVFRIIAIDKKSNKPIAQADFAYYQEIGEYVAWSVRVNPKQRRKGIATAIYQCAEQKLKETIYPFPGGHSVAAQKFWAQPNRPFGHRIELAD